MENISFELWNKIEPLLKNKKLKKAIMPYEAQPFQNYIFKKIRENYKKIKSIGYVHSTQPFPSHLFKREGSPDKIYVHGNDQKYTATNIWVGKSGKSIPSRILKKKKFFCKQRSSPYDFYDKLILNLLKT